MADQTGHGRQRDPAGWTAYGRTAGRPKIGTSVTVTLPDAQLAHLDEIAAARGVKRQDVLREAVTAFLRTSAVPRT